MPCPKDEIDHIVRQYQDEHAENALFMIDERIDSANAACNWDELEKWHRVRMRIQRLRLSRDAMQHWRVAHAHRSESGLSR
ncbi:hypothetical protein BH10PSE12_BH10PSE12_18380 [soil metagenome]